MISISFVAWVICSVAIVIIIFAISRDGSEGVEGVEVGVGEGRLDKRLGRRRIEADTVAKANRMRAAAT